MAHCTGIVDLAVEIDEQVRLDRSGVAADGVRTDRFDAVHDPRSARLELAPALRIVTQMLPGPPQGRMWIDSTYNGARIDVTKKRPKPSAGARIPGHPGDV
jgi:hypothetical protein